MDTPKYSIVQPMNGTKPTPLFVPRKPKVGHHCDQLLVFGRIGLVVEDPRNGHGAANHPSAASESKQGTKRFSVQMFWMLLFYTSLLVFK